MFQPIHVNTLHPGADSAAVIQDIFAMHIKPPASILDLTYGKGTFWKWPWESLEFSLTTNDWKTEADHSFDFTKDAPDFPDQSFDIVVFDPPFTANGPPTKGRHQDRYGSTRDQRGAPRNIKDVQAGLALGIATAARISRKAIIVKIQDVIESDKYYYSESVAAQALTHCGWRVEDIVRFLPSRRPQPDKARRSKIRHFRKHPSVFMYAVLDRSRAHRRDN